MSINPQKGDAGLPRADASDPIRIMIVDDSAVIRGLIARMVEGEADISVVSSVGNGQMAINNIKRYDVEVVIMDIEMPVMDGLTALPKILELDPTVQIIMASTLTLRNAEISFRALEAGAADYIPKPSSSRELSGGNDFRRELLDKIRALGGVRRKAGKATNLPPREKGPRTVTAAAKPTGPVPIKLRNPGTQKPSILAIGSSTGGPQALFKFLTALDPKVVNVPVVITQHMPATFTTILAEHINRMSGWPCSEAKTGDKLEPGKILLAPGGFHMVIEGASGGNTVRLDDGPQENFCRPSVDPMIRSLIKLYGGRILGVILTGMGADGKKACEGIVEAGGTVIAQDEKTSVVWGMPGAVAEAGICSAVKPLDELAPYVSRIVSGIMK